MLETEYLKLKYHANVESSSDATDVEEFFNNNFKKIDANAKKVNEDLIKLNEDLQQENTDLASNMPHNTVQGESLHIEDSAKYSRNRLSLSGNMKQEKRSGKNKFKIPESATSNGVTLTKNEDGSFTLNGTTTGVAIFNATLNNQLKTGTYTISYKSSVALGNSFFLRVRDENMILVNSANPPSQVIGNNSTHNAATYPASVESAIVAINLTQAGVTYNNVVIYPQLEEGTVATDWEQYGAMPSTEFPSMPVVATGVQKIRQLGKNVFDGEMELGNISATNGANENSNNRIRSKNYINVEGLTLIKLVNEIESIIKVIGVRYYDKNKNFIKSLTIYDTAKIPIYDNTKYIRFTVPDTTNLTLKYGINQDGSEEYEPYTEEINTLDLKNTELCAIKNTDGNVVVQDRAVYRNVDGVWKWQWEKNIKKVILNGTETSWNMSAGTSIFTLLNYLNSISSNNVAICSHYTFDNRTSGFVNMSDKSFGMQPQYANNPILVKDADYTNVEDFKTALSTNPITVYYILATPQYTDCTADQSAVLDKLYNNLKLNKGTNNIIVESDNGVGVNMKLTYMQDLQTKLNLLEAMCVSNASQEV